MKAILVGLGGRGRYWLGQCQKQPGVDVVAGVEPSAQNRARAAAECDLPELAMVFAAVKSAVESRPVSLAELDA